MNTLQFICKALSQTVYTIRELHKVPLGSESMLPFCGYINHDSHDDFNLVEIGQTLNWGLTQSESY